MDFNTYQQLATETAVYPRVGSNPTYPALGLAGETAETMEKTVLPTLDIAAHALEVVRVGIIAAVETGHVTEAIKKLERDLKGVINEEKRLQIKKELGDVLWYIANLAREFELTLDDVATENIAKLRNRREQNTLHGSGDAR